jgi:hypothetical protein
MKYLGCLIAMLGLLGAGRLQATPFLPYFAPVRTALTNQLTIASNTAPVNKKLITSLNAALKLVDASGKTNLANDAKLLAALIPALSKTSVSNVFNPLLDTALDNYLKVLITAAQSASNSLALAYPSAQYKSADKSLATLLATLTKADGTLDLVAASKLISQAVGQLSSAETLIAKAVKVALPPAGVTATVTGASSWKYTSTVAVATAVGYGGSSVVNSTQPLLKSPYGQRGITLVMYGIKSGANTLTVGTGSGGTCQIIISEAYLSGTAIGYNSKSGTIQVTYNPTSKALVGSFTAVLVNEDDSKKQINVTGTFSATTL